LFDKQDPYNPINRRISIVIMNKRTEEALLADGKSLDAENAQAVEDGLNPAQKPGTPAALNPAMQPQAR
jgi:chemotaxis protein MotB